MRWIGWQRASVWALTGCVALGVVACAADYETGSTASLGVSGASGASGAAGEWDWAGAGNGGAGGLDGGTVRPAKCDPTAEDAPDGDFVDQNCDGIDGDAKRALFVSPLGSDEDPGTKDAPLASLNRAIELAAKDGRDVYVCSATYEENVVIEGVGARIFGGFACEDEWSRTKRSAELVPPSGIALTIRKASSPVRIDSLSFSSVAAEQSSESSIAAVIVDSADVMLSHVELSAGKGADGAAGAVPKEFTAPAKSGRAGKDAPQLDCGDGDVALDPRCNVTVQPWKCASCSEVCETDGGTIAINRVHGGAGGNGFLLNDDGVIGVDAEPGNTAATQLKPKAGAQAKAGEQGDQGKRGSSGFGEVTKAGVYVASNRGTDGTFGRLGAPGKGGAGGAAFSRSRDLQYPRVGGSGGSSGLPGCGGRPGRGGGAGGASIGLISVNSTVTLERVRVHTEQGGAGGAASNGGQGQAGGPGGLGGRNNRGVRVDAQEGSAGGNGGNGGEGGPGAGGPSIGVVSVGAAPKLAAMVFDTGVGGRGAPSLPGGALARGADGLSEDTYVFEEPAQE